MPTRRTGLMTRAAPPHAKTAIAAATQAATAPSAEDLAAFEKGRTDPAIVAAAGVTNGMPAGEVFAAIVKAVHAADGG